MHAHNARKIANDANGLDDALDDVFDTIRTAANDGRYMCRVQVNEAVIQQVADVLLAQGYSVVYQKNVPAMFVRWNDDRKLTE